MTDRDILRSGPSASGEKSAWGFESAPTEAEHAAALAKRGVTRSWRLLDGCCCEGGAAKGYVAAGFDMVVGVDIADQPLYPFSFKRGDILELLADAAFVSQFDAFHASPPCQHYVELAKQNGNADDWPDLIPPVRELLIATGKPYVIENVDTAPLLDPVLLCGTMFPGLRVLRHRLFETNWPLVPPAVHPPHPLVFTHDKRKAHYGQLDQDTSFVQVTGGGNATIANKRAAMGMPWASNHGCNEAIPPAYSEWVGRQLLAHLEAANATPGRAGAVPTSGRAK